MTIGEIVVTFVANIDSIIEAVASINEQFASLTGIAEEAGTGMSEGLAQATSGVEEIVAGVDMMDEALTQVVSMADEAGAGLAEGLSQAVEEIDAVTTAGEQMDTSLADAISSLSDEITNLSANVADLADNLNSTSAAAEQASSGGGLGALIGGLGNIAGKVGMAYIGLQGFGQMAVQTAGNLIGTAATAEQTGVAFDTLMKSTSKAQAMLSKLNTFAATTPFQTQAIDDGASKLLAFGINAQDVIPDITGIGDSLSALGKATPAALGSIIDVFGKIQAADKLTGGDMMQLSRWGIPAWQMLSQVMGVPVDQLQKMVSKGLVPASTALHDLQAGMEHTFGGGMAKQAQTFTGLMSTFQSNVVLAWNSFLGVSGGQVTKGSIFDMVEQGLNGIGNILANPNFQKFAVAMGTDIGQSIQKVGSFLSSTLLPPFEQLGKALLPIITPIEQWAAKNDVLQKGLEGVGAAAGGLVIGIGKLIGDLASVIQWFEKGGPAAQAVEDALIGVGVAFAAIKIGQFISTIPALVAQLATWAVAQWTVAAAAIATALPYILIGALIALVIFGIIEAIQHWGAISKWLQGVWSAIASFFIGLWHGILDGIQSFVSTTQKVFQDIMGFIGNVVREGMNFIFLLFFGPIIAIVDLFKWLYAHNTYFQQLVDTIKKIITEGVAWLVSIWQDYVNGWKTLLEGLAKIVSEAWNAVYDAVKSVVTLVVTWLTDQWTTITDWLKQQWDKFADMMQTAWQAVSSVLTGLWNKYVATPFNDVWTQIKNWFDNLATQAYQSGSNFISMLVSGITDGAGAVWNAVTNIAGQIWKALGFNSPAEAGPASDADQWMPNFVNMMVSGLTNGIPLMQAAVNNFAMPLASLNTNTPGSTLPTSSPAPASAGGGTTHVTVQLDSNVLAEYMGQAMQRHIILHTGGLLP